MKCNSTDRCLIEVLVNLMPFPFSLFFSPALQLPLQPQQILTLKPPSFLSPFSDGGHHFDSNQHSNDISSFRSADGKGATSKSSKSATAAHMMARAGTNITLACPGVTPTR